MAFEPPHTTLVEVLADAVDKHGDRPLFGERKPDGWHWTSYREFGQLAERAAFGLTRLGIEANDRVAVISNNRLKWAIAAHGAFRCRACYVPMYEAQLPNEWVYILNDSESKVCFVANSSVEKRLQDARSDLPKLQRIINMDSVAWDHFMKLGEEHPAQLRSCEPEELATLIYTSGTTGQPKGVELSHRSICSGLYAVLDSSPVQGDDRSLAFLPWAHVFGGTIELNGVIALGASSAICDNTDRLLEYLPEVKPTVIFAVPRIWNRIYDGVNKQLQERPAFVRRIFERAVSARGKEREGQPVSGFERFVLWLADRLILSKVRARMGGRLRFAVSGAAALSREVATFMDNLGITVYEGYGLTECAGTATANNVRARRVGSVGKPLPGIEIRFDRTTATAGAGEGEIIVYGAPVMRGYHNLPEATREAFTDDGGLRTGDIGRMDEDGFVYITGRVKELFKLANGKYVAPAPLEEKLKLSPYISQCMIYGVDQPYNVAVIVPDMVALQSWATARGLDGSPEALQRDPQVHRLIADEIAKYSDGFKRYELVRDFLIETEDFTTANNLLTPTLKLKRDKVVARYEDRLRALYAEDRLQSLDP